MKAFPEQNHGTFDQNKIVFGVSFSNTPRKVLTKQVSKYKVYICQ